MPLPSRALPEQVPCCVAFRETAHPRFDSLNCPSVHFKDLEAHLAVCAALKCPHAPLGCKWEGTQSQLEEHSVECKFETMKDVLAGSTQQVGLVRKAA